MFSFLRQRKGFYSNLWALALPLILQNLITTSLGLIDTFMVGQLPGDIPIAAVALANIPLFVLMLIIFGLQSGSAVLISQFWGKRDTDSINRVLGIAFYVAGGATIFFAIILLIFPVQLISLFTNNADLIPSAASYVRIVGIAYFFDSISQIYIAAHRNMENPKLGLYILSVSMCANTFFNWIFIFGHLGAPALGVVGAAVGTLSARILQFIITIVYAFRNKRFTIKPSILLRPGTQLFHAYIHYASPVILNETLWGLGTSLFPTIMGYMNGSTEILAAYALSGNIERLFTVAVFALASTSATIIGREIGAGRRDSVQSVGGALIFVSLIGGFVVGIFLILATIFVLQPFVYPLFGLSAAAQTISTQMLIVVGAFMALRSFSATNVVGVLRGGGDVRVAIFIDIVPTWFIALPLAAITGLVLDLSIVWVYIGYNLENIVKFILGMTRYRSKKWINDITRAKQ